jgi:DNA-binding transcriptional LysR family regulator
VAQLGSAGAGPDVQVVRVGAGEYLLERLLRPALADFQLQNPRVQVAVERIESARDGLAAVRRGRLDFAYFTVHKLTPDQAVDVLANIRVGVFVSPSHALAGAAGVGRTVTLPLVMPLAGSVQERAISGVLEAGGVIDYQPVARVQYFETMVALAMAGVGACCVFREQVAAELADGRLVELGLDLPRQFRCVVRAPGAQARAHLGAFDRFATALIQAGEPD